MTRYPLVVVAFIAVVGLLTFASVRFGLGRLPGDIIINRDGLCSTCRSPPQSS